MGEYLDSRLGLGSFWASLKSRLTRPLPPGAGYRVTLGVVAIVLLLVQFVSGAMLAFYYQPTLEGAHDSVSIITQELRFGWLVRSVHIWAAHLLVGTVLLHLLAEFVKGSYRAPREFIWVAGTFLFFAVAAGFFSGQVLPMDQEAYQGLKIAGASAGPMSGFIIGGKDPSDFTMSRFFVGHILLVPAAIVALIVAHVALISKHRLHGAPEPTGSDPAFLTRAATASLVAIAAVAILAFAFPMGLKPKADFAVSLADSKPLWLFLPLYEAKKMGPIEHVVAFVIPILAVLVPFLDRGKSRAIVLAVGFIIVAALALLGVKGAMS
jgi:ubiquinol-cytochrome c reductase cytochrome b subunit